MKSIYVLLKKLRRKLIWAVTELARAGGAKSFRWGGPAGAFSIFENPDAAFIVVKGQPSIPLSPGSLRDISHLDQDKNQPWPIFWAHIPHARLVGDSLAVLNDKKKIMLESVHGPGHYRTDPSYNYLSLPPPTRLAGAWTSVLGRWCSSGGSRNYAHWMLDGLPRLALLDRFPSDTRILIPEPLLSYRRDSLKILGVLDRCRPTPETHLLVENYYYSSATSMPGCDNPYAIRFLRDRFLKAASPVALASNKIYIARKGGARTPLQEEEMIEFLQGEGWTILQAEKYSLSEQIGIFRNARAVCSIHGAGLTNLLWCDKGSKVLELCADNFLNGSLEGLALCLNLDHRFLVFPADSKWRINVDMKKFKAAVAAMG